jgi:hypothetical protein
MNQPINLKKTIFCCFGLNRSGKSYFIKNAIIPNYRCIVFDPNGEYASKDGSFKPSNCDYYIPKKTSYPCIALEFEHFLDWFKKNKSKYDLLIIDEADSVFPNKKPLYPNADNLKGKFRHNEWGNIGIGFACRRPAQLFTDFPSLSYYLFIFGNKGAADIQRLNSESEGLGDLAKQLDVSKHEYILVNPDRSYTRMHPI